MSDYNIYDDIGSIDINAFLPIPEAFHQAIAYYVAYKELSTIFMHEDLSQSNNKLNLLIEYNQRAEIANSRLKAMKKSRKRIKYAPFI
ncbi:MAG: hypothetical protein PHF63_13070 [Herbinix sp.]|nr:hypothetical protein [Herbinix sp.]